MAVGGRLNFFPCSATGVCPEVIIRDARLEDLAALVAIYNAAIPGRMATADLDPLSRSSWL